MKDDIVISITAKGDTLEVKIAETAYNNFAIVGLLEKIKLDILEGSPVESKSVNPNQKYDA
jgi:hypothetical protein